MKTTHTTWAVLLVALVGAPLAGLWASGRPIAPYLEFPPQTRYVSHAPFSWTAFIVLSALVLAVILPFEAHACRNLRHATGRGMAREQRRFPAWGWLGAALTLVAWILAWTRVPWFTPAQAFTFSPLWFGYILVVNAWTLKRSGRCMLVHRTRLFLALFAWSAVFWWFFEYLNRFVQNWYYVGISALSGPGYFVFATLPFSTVLPAVLGTYELLRTFTGAGAGLDSFMRWRGADSRTLAWVILAAAFAGLAGIGIWPGVLFPLLWVSPVCIMLALQIIRGEPTLFSPTRQGRWRQVYLFAAAALICGFFWEMWNFGSAAKWIYAVPYVDRFHLFEMPVLGYAGYLPFGLECAVVAELAGWRGDDDRPVPEYVGHSERSEESPVGRETGDPLLGSG